MIWSLILPVSLILIFALRLLYPDAKRAFQSSLIFFAIASLLQFQNCSFSPEKSLDKASPTDSIVN